jgi:integrase
MGKLLTDIAIRNLRPAAARYEKPAGNGLYVVVQPTGKKSYAVRYRYGGRPRKLTLPGGLTLKAARKAASDALFDVERGNDPAGARRHEKQQQRLAAADTFKAIAEEYFKREGQRLRSVADRKAALERLVYPTLGDRPIAEIRRSEIVRLLDKIEAGEMKDTDGDALKGGAFMAHNVLAYVRKIMNWHAARSDDFRSPIVRGMGRINAKESARERILTDDEIRAVWKTADGMNTPFARWLQFSLLTAARKSEAAKMPLSELSGSDWLLPAARNKAKQDLIRPLSQAAQDILKRTPKLAGCEFVFSSNGKSPIGGFSQYKTKFDEACGVTDWTLHDLRRTARSLMSRAGVDADHAERCLGHVIPGVRGIYDRHEYYAEKQRAYEALAALIKQILNPQDNDNVVSLASGRA